jgi:hypothetical protein
MDVAERAFRELQLAAQQALVAGERLLDRARDAVR